MSFESTRKAWACQVSPIQKLVLLALCDCQNHKTRRCDPSRLFLMRMTGLSRTAISDAIKILESRGLITPDRGNGRRSTYVLKLENQTATLSGSEPDRHVVRTATLSGPDRHVVWTRPPRCPKPGNPGTNQENSLREEPAQGELFEADDPTPAKAKVTRKEKRTQHGQPAANGATNAWAAWVDVHRSIGREDPLAVGPDTKASKELARLIPDGEELKCIMQAYLQDGDPWLQKTGHALRNLSSRINAYTNRQTPGHAETINDAANRIARELRASKGAAHGQE